MVFDTNVLVSALAMPGSRGEEALLRITRGRDELLFSRPILDELLEVLARKFSRNPEELSRVALLIGALGKMVAPDERVTVLADEPDNRILECALAGRADVIVTGDKTMLALGTWRQVRLASLAEYLAS